MKTSSNLAATSRTAEGREIIGQQLLEDAKRLYPVALAALGNKAVAADLLETAVRAAWEEHEASGGPFDEAALRKLVSRALAAHARAGDEGPRPKASPTYCAECSQATGIARSWPSAEQLGEGRAPLRNTVTATLDRLPRRARVVFALLDIGGFTLAEVAAALRETEERIRAWLQEARLAQLAAIDAFFARPGSLDS